MSTSKEVVEKITATTLLIIAIITVLMTCLFNIFIFWLPPSAYCTQSVSVLIPTPGLDLLGWPFIIILLVALLRRVQFMRKYLNTMNITYLYIIALAVSCFSCFGNPWWWDIGLLLARVPTSEHITQYVPEFVAIPKDTAQLLIEGMGSITALPWHVLLPAVIWHSLLVALFAGVSVGLVSIFRREWVDVERLPFPQIAIAYASISSLENVGKREWFGRIPFIVGFLAGILTAIPLSGVTLFPWFPDLYGWRSNTCGPGCQQFGPPGQPWNLGLAKHPPLYALLLLVPFYELVSIVFYTLILEIALYVAWYSGYYTGIENMGFCGRNWCSPTPYGQPPLYFSAINVGAVLGIFVITIFLERQHIMNTLRVAFGKSSLLTEKEEPMSYRTAWIIFSVCFILMILFFVYTGMSLWVSFVASLSGVVTWFALTQVWGRIGFTQEPCYDFTPGFIKLLAWPTDYGLPITSTDLAITPALSRHWIAHRSLAGWGNSFYTFIGSYYMARRTGVNLRNVLKVASVALFTSIFVAHILQVAIPGVYGGKLRMGSLVLTMDLDSFRWALWDRPATVPMSELGVHVALGFVFMIVMRYLSTKILWLPNPFTAVVAWSWISSLHGLWVVALVDAIVKYLILKIGGSKLYEDGAVPFVGGFILGDALEVLVAALLCFALFPV